MRGARGSSSIPSPAVLGIPSGIQPHSQHQRSRAVPGVTPAPPAALPIPNKGSVHPGFPGQARAGAGAAAGADSGPPGQGSAQSGSAGTPSLLGAVLGPLLLLPQPAHGCSDPKIPFFPPFSGRCRCSGGGMWVPKQPPGEGGSEPGVTQRGTDTSPTPHYHEKSSGMPNSRG